LRFFLKGALHAVNGALHALNGALQAVKGALHATNGALHATKLTTNLPPITLPLSRTRRPPASVSSAFRCSSESSNEIGPAFAMALPLVCGQIEKADVLEDAKAALKNICSQAESIIWLSYAAYIFLSLCLMMSR
jgi:hypothetical protein